MVSGLIRVERDGAGVGLERLLMSTEGAKGAPESAVSGSVAGVESACEGVCLERVLVPA
jgi:hypothetical protein